jgi:hypothetical protein
VSETGKGVTVTITPGGKIRDVAIGGYSVGQFISGAGASLDIEHRRPPILSLTLVADEIIVKEPDEPASDPQAR